MPLTNDDRAWVARFLGNATPGAIWDNLPIYDRLKARNAIERRDIATARLAAQVESERSLEKHVPALQEIARIKVMVRDGMKQEKTKKKETPKQLSLVGVDPEQTYGHKYDIPTSMIDAKLLKSLGIVEKDFLTTARELTGRTCPWSVLKNGEIVREQRPLFDKMGAHEVVYEPFVRRGLFPEDQILAEFSRAQEMIDKSNRLYLEELAEIEDEPDWQNTVTQVQTVLSGLGSVVTASFGVSETVDPTMHDTAKDVRTIVTIVDASLKAVTTGVVEFSKKNAEDGVKGLLEGLGTAIGTGVGGDTGKYIALGFKAAAQVPILIKTLRTATTDGECVGQLLAQLGDAIILAVSLENVGKKGDGVHNAKQITVGVKAGLVMIGKAFEKDLIGAVKKARNGDTSALKRFAISYGAAVASEITVAVTTVMSNEVIKAKKENLDPTKNPNYQSTPEYAKFLKSIEGKGLSGPEDVAGAWKDYRGDLAKVWMTTDSGQLAKQADSAKVACQALESILDSSTVKANSSKLKEEIANRDDIEYQEDDYLEALESLQGDPPKDALKRIGKLIAKIQKQRAILSLISGVVKTGSAGVARFWGAAAAAGTALDLALQIKQAVETHQELITWRQSSEYAENASSPYFTSVVSFVTEQERLYPRDVVKSIMLTVKLGAQIAQAEPTFGLAIGKLVEAVEGVAESAMDLICAQIDAAKVEKAWKITKIAFENPDNRKAALIARKLNPTLAKYTLAWGAMIAKDVVAKEACAEIGLTEGDLRAPADKANDAVKILVQYFEVRYQRHLQVKKHYDTEDESRDLTWSKDVSIGSLVLETWLNLCKTAVENGMQPLDPNKVGAALCTAWSQGSNLDRDVIALYDISRDKEQHLTADQVNQVHIKSIKVKAALAEAKKRLVGFKPVRKSDNSVPDLDMEAVVELYLAQVDAEEINIDMALSALDMAVERERLTGFGVEELMKLAKETEKASAEVLVKDSAGLLNTQIAAVEKCNDTDKPEDLQDVFNAATSALTTIEKRILVCENPLVSGTAKSLREKLAPLERLLNLKLETGQDEDEDEVE